MVGNYCIQLHDKNGIARMRETVFKDFKNLLQWLKMYDAKNTPGTINVHLPSRATDAERQSTRHLGFELS
jgi:hypothetical protein